MPTWVGRVVHTWNIPAVITYQMDYDTLRKSDTVSTLQTTLLSASDLQEL